MPGFDGTGPAGYGPMTGGRRGYCRWDPVTGVPVWEPQAGRPAREQSARARRRGMTRLERIEAKLEQALDRLERLETPR